MFKFIKRLFAKKRVNMLRVKDLKELKTLATQLKNEIQAHHDADPDNVDDTVNQLLFGILHSAENCIKIIEENNNIEL